MVILPSDSPAASSNEIRDLVKNEKLQKLIYSIDCSADPENVSVMNDVFPLVMSFF